MAKQVGLFSLRGKIENKSFYKTAGVPETVIRGIPEGLSSRVKTAEEYANTRLNNAEFKNANSIATAAFNAVSNRKRGMMRRFAIADMTKKALDDIKQGSGVWGARHAATELDHLICDMLENHAKGGSYQGEFGTFEASAISTSGVVTMDINISVEIQNQWKALGVDGILAVASKALAGEVDVDGLPRLYAGNSVAPWQPVPFAGTSEISIQNTIQLGTPSSVGMSQGGYALAQTDPKHGFYGVLTILPYRTEGGTMYTMQEYCTFVAVPFGQIPE